MSLDDWILVLHLLAAFALVGAATALWIVIVAVRRAETPSGIAGPLRLVAPLNAASGVGAVGTLVFGIWLAISLEGYEVWDGWVIAAIVLWAAAGYTGDKAGREYAGLASRAGELADGGDASDAGFLAKVRASRPLALHAIASVLVILLLADMIWKPGA